MNKDSSKNKSTHNTISRTLNDSIWTV